MTRSVQESFRYCCVFVITCLLSGCMGGGSVPIRYYLIDPVELDEIRTAREGSLTVEILDLHVPQYLERFHIATRRDGNRLVFSDGHQWGESLRKNLMRTLARNLSRQLNTVDVATPLKRSSSPSDVRLQVYIDRFELDADGRVRLAARWQITDGESNATLDTRRADYSGDAVIGRNDYSAMVADMQELFGRLSHAIAGSITDQAGGEH